MRHDVEYQADEIFEGVTATAKFDIDASNELNADCGGIDGYQVHSCALLSLTIGELDLTRAQIVAMFGQAWVMALEAGMAETHEEEHEV